MTIYVQSMGDRGDAVTPRTKSGDAPLSSQGRRSGGGAMIRPPNIMD
jgi:hypothetical protein